MKRLSMVLVGMLLICSLLTGCGNTDASEKMCRIEIIYEEDSKVIKTLDNITQDDAADGIDIADNFLSIYYTGTDVFFDNLHEMID